MAEIIEFYVPCKSTRWIPPQQRGKVLEFALRHGNTCEAGPALAWLAGQWRNFTRGKARKPRRLIGSAGLGRSEQAASLILHCLTKTRLDRQSRFAGSYW